jgi:hypothetical protein
MAADLVYPRRCRFLGWHVTIFSLPGSPSTTPTNVLETVHFEDDAQMLALCLATLSNDLQ